MGFTDQKPHIATEKDETASWSGAPEGKRFRCYLCGHKFKVGDQFRFIFGYDPKTKHGDFIVEGKERSTTNFLVCEKCDTGDNYEMREKWIQRNKEYYSDNKFWAFREEEE